jgi:hypothetical protein
MAKLDECRETERCSDVLASDDYAARLAAVVFEWRRVRARTAAPSAAHERSLSTQLWMSRNTRHTDVTS